MDRFDALAEKGDERLLVLTGESLAGSQDEELQHIVAEVAETFGSPLALVSLVLRRTQFFRAQHGLPPDLAAARATDRDVSLCQFVVRDEAPLAVEDAEKDPTVPKRLVEEYGLRSYLGYPVRIGSVVVGSLCAMDTRPRTFDDNDIRTLEAFAERASRRLGELAVVRRHEAIGRALAPAFAELRNILSPMVLGLGTAEAAAVELGAFQRASAQVREEHPDLPVHRVLTRAEAVLSDLSGGLANASTSLQKLRAMLEAMETAILRGEPTTPADEILGAAATLAYHMTKLVGGVDIVEPIPIAELAVRRGPAVMFLSTVVTTVVGSGTGGKAAKPSIEATETEEDVCFAIESERLGEDDVAVIVERLAQELPETEGVSLRANGRAIVVAMRKGHVAAAHP